MSLSDTLAPSEHPSAEVLGTDLSPIQPKWYRADHTSTTWELTAGIL